MVYHTHTLSVRTLGDFAITCDRKPVTVRWPDNATKMLFCSLLSPLDASISRDRLCKALWDIKPSASGMERLTDVIGRLHDVMIRTFGFNPMLFQDDGVTLDCGKIYVDARDFHDTAISGCRHFSSGETAAALRLFRTASTLYRGTFLPEMNGRIITATRSDIEQQYQMLAKQLTPPLQRPAMNQSKYMIAFCCTC